MCWVNSCAAGKGCLLWAMCSHSCHLLLDHVQFTLIHGSNSPDSNAISFFIALDFSFTTRYIHNWASFLLWPSCFILNGALRNCPPLFPSSTLDTFQPGWGGAHHPVSYLFASSYYSWFLQQEYWSGLPFPFSVDHIFCQNSAIWPICLGWPWRARLIALLS